MRSSDWSSDVCSSDLVLVVGAGPAGMRAALEHGKTGHQVLVVDDQPVPGGSLLYADDQIDGVAAEAWLNAQLLSLAGMGNVRLLSRCSAFGYYDHNQIQAVQLQPGGAVRQRLLDRKSTRLNSSH